MDGWVCSPSLVVFVYDGSNPNSDETRGVGSGQRSKGAQQAEEGQQLPPPLLCLGPRIIVDRNRQLDIIPSLGGGYSLSMPYLLRESGDGVEEREEIGW